MISIRSEVEELERYHQIRARAINCYVAAIRNIADYAIELEPAATGAYRQHLSTVAESVSSGDEPALDESRATIRGLLRDYRDKASKYINEIRGELAETARALQELMATLADSDGDHEQRLRTAVARLREISTASDAASVSAVLLGAADSIEKSVAEMRAQHQLTINQFQAELRVLHRRIDTLERAAAIDNLSQLYRRSEMEQRLAAITPQSCIVMIRVSGLRVAARTYDSDVASELTAAFARRLRNTLPDHSAVGRWSEEEFLAIAPVAKPEALKLAKWIAEHLAGPYSCLQNGKLVKPALQLSVGVVDPGEDTPERVVQRVNEFLPARGAAT